MKKWIKCLIVICSIFLFAAGPGNRPSYAASRIPAQVQNVKALGWNRAVKLTWSKVKGAKGYIIYYVDHKNKKKRIVITPGSKTESTIRELKNGKEYAFRVASFGKDGDEKHSKLSAYVKATPKKPDMEKPELKKVRISSNTVKLYWNEVKNASFYNVRYKIAKDKKEYTVIRNIKKKKYVLSGLKNETKYDIQVQAVGSVKGKTVKSIWTKIKVVPISDAAQKKYLSTIDHTDAYAGGVEPTKQYSKKVAEAFANYGNDGHAFQSKTNYFLWLNTHGLHLYVFQRGITGKWELLYRFPCAIGRSYAQTPRGLWTLETKQYKDDHGSFYVLYCLFFTGYNTNSIHSQCYPVQQDPLKVGYFGSAGCVRCDLKYAKFIYENCEGSPFLVR